MIGTKGCEIMESPGKIIKRMMDEQGVSNKELAMRVNKTPNTISTALTSRHNMSFNNFAEYIEALGYDMYFKDKRGDTLPDKPSKKEHCAPPTRLRVGNTKYNSMTSEPLLCTEQSDGLYAELYRKTGHEYFIVYFEKGGRGTINPVSEISAKAFWRQYKSDDDKDEYLD